MSKLVSPDEMLQAAVEMQLHGRQPETWEDWAQVINFVAYNIGGNTGVTVAACVLFGVLYPDCPLTDEEITAIAVFQSAHKIIEK